MVGRAQDSQIFQCCDRPTLFRPASALMHRSSGQCIPNALLRASQFLRRARRAGSHALHNVNYTSRRECNGAISIHAWPAGA